MPAFVIGYLTVYAIYVVAAVAFVLTERGGRRFVPVASVAVGVLPWLLIWSPGVGVMSLFLTTLCPLLSVVLVFYTLQLTWSGKRFVELVLRMTAVVILGFLFAMFFLLPGVI